MPTLTNARNEVAFRYCFGHTPVAHTREDSKIEQHFLLGGSLCLRSIYLHSHIVFLNWMLFLC